MSKQVHQNRIIMSADKKRAEVLIYDVIGDSWFMDGVSAKGFAEAVSALGDVPVIDVRINSPGGDVFQGLAIYNTLNSHGAKINVFIDGVAASMASIIAMAGDEIDIAENALFMIHNPRAFAAGDAEAMLAMATRLEQITAIGVDIYAARTKQEPEAIRSAMAKETWYSAKDALAAGFATKISPNKQITASFDVDQFSNAPEWAQQQLRQFTCLATEEPINMADDVAPKADEAKETPAIEAAANVDASAVAASAKAEERERITKIQAICARAGKPEMAAQFCESDASVADVQARMFDVLCQSNKPVGDSEPEGEQPKENAKYVAEYKANAAYAKAFTEDEYVAMRRVDDGLDQLVAPMNQ